MQFAEPHKFGKTTANALFVILASHDVSVFSERLSRGARKFRRVGG
jgi:hypothetical protein